MEKNLNRVINVCEIYYALKDDIASVEISEDGKIDVAFNVAVEWEQIPFTPGSATISEKAVMKEGGRCYEQDFVADIPGEDEEMTSWTLDTDLRPVIMKLVQTNGTKIYGDTEYPVRLTSEWNSEKSSTTIRFNRDTMERARWLNEETSGSGS